MAFCFCFIVGVAVFSFLEEADHWPIRFAVIFFLALFALALFWPDKVRRFLIFCLIFFIFGGWRFVFSLPEINFGQIVFYNEQRVAFVGYVAEEPNVKIDGVDYVLAAESVEEKPVAGRVLLQMPLYPRFAYGERLSVHCLLRAPTNAAGSSFRYDKYLANEKIYSICGWAKVEKIGVVGGHQAKKILLAVKASFGRQIERLFPEPESSLLAGLLYGGRSSLPPEVSNSFRRVGLSHIIAVSGYNISIIAVVFLNLLIFSGLSRPRAFWLAIFGLFVFVIFCGASASAVRAGVMGALVLSAEKIGRPSGAGRLLLLAAVAILLFNPRLLVWDAGFQLSFLATLGLIYLAPIFWAEAGGRFGDLARAAIAPTLAAIIATAPLVLFQFNQFSAVALLVNLLVIWLIPWLMLFGFLSVVFGFVFYPFGQVIAWLAGFGLKYVIIISTWFSARPWAAIQLGLPWWGMVGIYLLLIYWVVKKREKILS